MTELVGKMVLAAAAQAEVNTLFAAQVDKKLREQRKMAEATAARSSGASRRHAQPGLPSVTTPVPKPEYVEFELPVSTLLTLVASPF